MTNDFALSVPATDRAEFQEFAAAMETVGAEHRQILLLVGLEGLSYREIADELGLPIGTVMSRLARARARLRNALETGGQPAAAEVASLSAYRKKSS